MEYRNRENTDQKIKSFIQASDGYIYTHAYIYMCLDIYMFIKVCMHLYRYRQISIQIRIEYARHQYTTICQLNNFAGQQHRHLKMAMIWLAVSHKYTRVRNSCMASMGCWPIISFISLHFSKPYHLNIVISTCKMSQQHIECPPPPPPNPHEYSHWCDMNTCFYHFSETVSYHI